jgi:hypothetical protein
MAALVAFGIILLTLVWIFSHPESYLKASLVFGSLLMFLGMIGVHLVLEKSQLKLDDNLHGLLVVFGSLGGFAIIATSWLTLWAANNFKREGTKEQEQEEKEKKELKEKKRWDGLTEEQKEKEQEQKKREQKEKALLSEKNNNNDKIIAVLMLSPIVIWIFLKIFFPDSWLLR